MIYAPTYNHQKQGNIIDIEYKDNNNFNNLVKKNTLSI